MQSGKAKTPTLGILHAISKDRGLTLRCDEVKGLKWGGDAAGIEVYKISLSLQLFILHFPKLPPRKKEPTKSLKPVGHGIRFGPSSKNSLPLMDDQKVDDVRAASRAIVTNEYAQA